MKAGRCDAAIVGGSNLCLHPQTSLHYGRKIPLCKDGKVKSFDENADGTARSDAINVLFLQKEKDALRVYAEIVHVKTQYLSTLKEKTEVDMAFNFEHESSVNFLNTFYQEAKISPSLVGYVEAYGLGVPNVDKSELKIIDEVFCKDRTEPILVGSVTSNIGYTDNASGISGITKVLLGYHHGLFASNLHCTKVRQDIAGFQENRMRLVTDNFPYPGAFSAVNGISYTGIKSHVLLNGRYKAKDLKRYKSNIPYLVTASGRMQSAVRKIFNDLNSRPIDPEQLALLNNIFETEIPGHISRGFAIFEENNQGDTVKQFERIEDFDDKKPPLWFVYSGMGSQWAGMGAYLMEIPVFASAIKRCHDILKPKGVDLIYVVTSNDKTVFDNVLHSFVGITAVQIGLTNLLRELGLVPDKIIGHSMGEMACAYADDTLSIEETILAAYARGYISLTTPFIRGSMVAVGLGYKDILALCPPEIEVACQNGPDSCTLSGPAEVMPAFVAQLHQQGIFAKEVACSNIAYHSKYIAEAGPILLSSLKEIIKVPKLRSNRWLSSSVPQEKWHETHAKYSSAEYHANNMMGYVLFEQVLRMIPERAVLIEIAPHGLLQAILKRSLPETCQNIAMTRRGHSNGIRFLLEALGKLYNVGFNYKIKNLYPKVEFPVSTGTPFLSHMIEWAHQEKWNLILYVGDQTKTMASCKFPISIHDEENSYLKGHLLRGKPVYPFAGALVTVWDTLAMSLGATKKELSVKFHDVNFYTQPMLYDQHELKLNVNINQGSGYFEVLSGKIIIISGYIFAIKEKNMNSQAISQHCSDNFKLYSKDIYQLLNERDHYYEGDFRSIVRTNGNFTSADIKWNNNWVTFIDAMIQINTLNNLHSTISQLCHINTITIDLTEPLTKKLYTVDENSVIKMHVLEDKEETRCGGVSLKLIKFCKLDAVPNYIFSLRLDPELDKVHPYIINNRQQNNYSSATMKRIDLDQNIKLISTEIGNFRSLKWIETSSPSDSGLNVMVHYAGINYYDVTVANGTIPYKKKTEFGKISYGMDFSGILERTGERVMGVVREGAVSRQLCTQPEMLWPIPDQWSLEEAATVPLPYLHAFYCLGIKYKISRYQSILVVGGAGALGQAVISVALGLGCEVFTTVGDMQKKKTLLQQFPKLNGANIVNSNDISFADLILRNTEGNGCDIVISCVKGSLRENVLCCCARFGVTIDVVQVHSQENYALKMACLYGAKNYVTVNLSSVFHEENHEDLKKLQILMSDGIKLGYVRPLTRVTFEPREVVRAFSLVAERRNRGRVLLDIRKPFTTTQSSLVYTADQNSDHWIICDSEVFGTLWAEKLISCGARKLIISCSNTSNYFHFKIGNWRRLGLKIRTSAMAKEDISNQIRNEFQSSSKIEGIYVIGTQVPAHEIESIVNIIDESLSKNNISTKNFAVISPEEIIGKYAYPNRIKDNLLVTCLNMPTLKDLNKEIHNMPKWRGATDAIEQALLSCNSVATAHCNGVTNHLSLQQTLALADIKITKETDLKLNLQDLKVSLDTLQSISDVLRNNHNLFLTSTEISLLTLKEIQDLQKLEELSPQSQGLATFFSSLCPDEISCGAEIIIMPTRTFSERMITDNFDAREPFISIIPGIESNYERFKKLCARLKLNALVLQSRFDIFDETLPQIAEKYTKVLLRKTNLKDNFYLLGYESGGLVALEIAAILEERGLTGKVFIIGFLPEEFKDFMEKQFKADGITDETSLQNTIIKFFINLMGCTITRTEDTLLQSLSWTKKIDLCLNILKGKVPYTLQYLRAIFNETLAQIRRIRSYNINRRTLKSQIILIKPNNALDDSDLNKSFHFNENIIVHELQTPFPQVSEDTQCAAIVNKYLNRIVLDKFEKKNICEPKFSARFDI